MFGLWSLLLMRSGNITREMVQLRWHPLMMCVGLADAFNGIFIVYSSILSRVSGPLQAVLALTMLPFTLFFSRVVLQRANTRSQLVAGFLVFCGSILCLVPTFHRVATGTLDFSSSSWWWPIIALMGQAPGALMNVLQQRFQEDFNRRSTSETAHEREFSVIYFQFVESFYQLVSMSALFFFDILPRFGSSANISQFLDNFKFGWMCLANSKADTVTALSDRCNYNGGLAALFIGFYIMTYVFSTLATRHASANLLSTITTVSPIIALTFWLIFPDVNAWAGGSDYTALDAGFNLGALGLILPGIWLYHRFTPTVGAVHTEQIELCFPHGYCCG